jgi:subtilase family serine protease
MSFRRAGEKPSADNASWRAMMKLRSIAVSFLVLLTIVTLAQSTTGQPEEMNLEGRIFLWDDSPLQGLPWEDSTPFAVWVLHSGSWNRFPKASWVLTSGGWYAYTLEAAERDINWSNGDTYRIQLDATAFGGLDTNATSHGTGDPGEFPPYGELENIIMWNDPDNTQQWDVVVPIPDLRPFAIAVDGIGYPGPYDQAVPIGPIVVLAGTSHVVEANVTNAGTPLIRILNTATLDDSCGAFEHLGEIQEIGPGSSAPPGARFSTIWTAPALPFIGDCLLNYTVDLYDNVTEYDEGNNSATILFHVEGPDLSPSDILIETPSGNYSYTDPSMTVPPYYSDMIPANPGDDITISLNATNVGGYETGAQFNVVTVSTGNISGGPPVSMLFNSGQVGPLMAGSSNGPFVSNLQISNQTGYHCLNLTVDYGIGGTGNISEVSETNNTFVVCFGVDVPDLTPVDIAVELQDGLSLIYPDASATNYISDPIYVFPGDLMNITASVRNVGVFQSPAGIDTQLSFYYVGDNPLNPIQDHIAEWSNVPPLLPGSTDGPFGILAYSIPFDMGHRYINITVDNRSQIQEESEVNNTFTIHLVIGGPDLIPSQVNLTVDGVTTPYVYPQTPTIEVDITSVVSLEADIANQGNFGTNGTFSTEFLDNSIAFHSNLSDPLGPGAASPMNSSWTNPGVPSLHTITVVADSADEIVEVNESNNIFTLVIVVKGPDLIPSNVTINVSGQISPFQYSDSPAGPVIVDISENVRIDVTIHNQGGLPAGTFRVGFLEDSQLFSMSGPLGPLDSSLSSSLTGVLWPNPQALGDYSVTASVDHLDSVSEVSEDNNVFEILFRVIGPDLMAFDFLVDSASPAAPVSITGGETVILTGVALNSGTNVTQDSFSVSIYNSTERGSPLVLLSVSPLHPGAFLWLNATWHAPMDYLNVTIVFEIDFYDDVLEVDEANNMLEVILIVTPLPPDLVAVGPMINGLPYDGSHPARAGETLTLSASIVNIGSYTTGGPFDNAFYNDTMSSLPFAREVEGTLIVGRTTAEIEATWKAPEKAGTYVVVFHADYMDSISEANETNNMLSYIIEVVEEEGEYNWKPLLALILAIFLVLLGILVGYVRPLDRFVPIPKDMPDEEIEIYRRQMKSQPIGEKLSPLDQDAMLSKLSRDRMFTIAILALPLSLLEIAIAILSNLTGILRVPEAGNWITVGLVVNITILIVGISIDTIASKKGYKVPSEMILPPEADSD